MVLKPTLSMRSRAKHLFVLLEGSEQLSRSSRLQVIACLDVRSNDTGDLVVTKGDQYDVREQTETREVIALPFMISPLAVLIND